MILQDTLHDAVVLSIFDFLLGFIVLYAIGFLIRGLKYVEFFDRGQPEPEVKVRSGRVEPPAQGRSEPAKLKTGEEA